MLDTLNDKLVGISMSNGKHHIYIPVNHISDTYKTLIPGQLPEQRVIELFRNIFDTRNDIKWVLHNSKFDCSVLRTFFGFKFPDPYWDTLICSWLLNQTENHGLKALYNKYIAVEDEGVNKFDTLFGGLTFSYIPIDVATIYAGKDALMTYKLFEYQKKIIEKPDMSGIKYILHNIEMPLIPILEDMHRQGIDMNMNMLHELYLKYDAQLKEAEQRVYDEIAKFKVEIDNYRREHRDVKLDDPILISSPSQLGVLFYKILHYKTKSGKGTGVADLQEINTPLTQALLDYRKADKLINAFLVSLPKQRGEDGKIHTVLNQMGADTGRFSSSSPNLQQIPSRGDAKELRRLFGARKGYIMLSSDFSRYLAA